MSITTARKMIEVPGVVPSQNGVLSVARVIDASDPHELLGVEYETDACTPPPFYRGNICDIDPLVGSCSDPDHEGEHTKDFEWDPNLVQGSPFIAFAGAECELQSPNISTARAERLLSYTESRNLDRHFAELFENAATPATTLTPAADIVTQLARMDNEIGWAYGGYGTILMSRANLIRAHAAQAIVQAPGGGWETPNGTRVAGCSFNPFDYNTAIYGTGQITLIRGDVQSHIVPAVIRPTGECDPPRALAERIWVPLIECLTLKGEVTSSAI